MRKTEEAFRCYEQVLGGKLTEFFLPSIAADRSREPISAPVVDNCGGIVDHWRRDESSHETIGAGMGAMLRGRAGHGVPPGPKAT